MHGYEYQVACHMIQEGMVAEGLEVVQAIRDRYDGFKRNPWNEIECGNNYARSMASYALLILIIAKVTGLKPGEFVHTLGDAHLYLNHLDQVDEQLKRQPFPLPKMSITKDIKNVLDIEYEDFSLEDYESHPHISAPIAV